MNLQSYIKNVDTKEVVTCILLIVVGYMTAQLFMRKCNGFRVGGQKCECTKTSGGDCVDGVDSKTTRNSKFCTDQTTKDTCLSAGGRIGPGKFVGKNTCKWIPGPPGPSPANSKTSYNCNASKCVSVSGTSGTYSSESDCQSKCGKPSTTGGNTPPTVSCSFTGSFDTGVCYLNKKTVDPTDSKYDSECQDCQWYSRWQFYILSICIIFGCGILGGVIGYNSGSGEYISYGFGGLFAGIVITVITGLVINYTIGTLTTNKTQN